VANSILKTKKLERFIVSVGRSLVMSLFHHSRLISLAILGLLSCCLAMGFSQVLATESQMGRALAAEADFAWNLPEWAPKPVVPADNPMTQAKVELGRHLFYEKRLSVNGRQSCASCHIQALAFTDGKAVSVGTTGEAHPRNAMSLANVAYNSVLTWANPLMRHLEQQMLVPLFGEEPVELGMAGKEAQLLALLQEDENYARLFSAAFPDADEAVSNGPWSRSILPTTATAMVATATPFPRRPSGGKPYSTVNG
jgi:cytochrome c peroxidase